MHRPLRWRGKVAVIGDDGQFIELVDTFDEAADRCFELNEKDETNNDEHAD